jgi:YbbR domain-containing protein
VKVDKLVTKEIPVRPTYNGGTAEGYQAEPIEGNPETISISGPDDMVSKVAYAWVNVMRENISKTVEEDFPFVLLDEEGHEVVSEYITASQEKIRVTIPVVMVKEVPLIVNLTPGAGANESNATWTASPATIKLSGDPEILSTFNNILLDTIDLSKFLTATTVTLPIVIPNNTTNLTGETEATVTVSIAGLETAHLSATNIQVTNIKEGYSAQLITQSLDVTLRGEKDVIDEVQRIAKTTPSIIRIEADLSEYGNTTGTFTVIAKVYVDGGYTNIGAVGEYKVTMSVTKD